MATRYRILPLDGGGSWVLIQARALRRIYGDLCGRELLAQFDLMAANSGGAIVAAALACDFTLGEIDALFADDAARSDIFVLLPPWECVPHAVLDWGRSILSVPTIFSRRRMSRATPIRSRGWP